MFSVSDPDCMRTRSFRAFCFAAPPTLDRSNLVDTYQVKFNQTARLECPMDGTPQPHIMWLMNGRDLHTKKGSQTMLDHVNRQS